MIRKCKLFTVPLNINQHIEPYLLLDNYSMETILFYFFPNFFKRKTSQEGFNSRLNFFKFIRKGGEKTHISKEFVQRSEVVFQIWILIIGKSYQQWSLQNLYQSSIG